MFENYPVDEALRAGAPGGLRFENVAQQDETHYPMTLTVQLAADQSLRLALGYERVRFGDEMVDLLAGCLQQAIAALAADGARPLGTLVLLDEAQAQQIAHWGTHPDTPVFDEPIHRLIERQARDRPEAPALVHGERCLSHAALNAQANRLAHRLIALGVGPESRVGIALDRGIEMVVGLLAVLKAGGAYVPLDPDYPAERIAHMVEDSRMSLVLTQSRMASRLAAPGAPGVVALDALDLHAESAADPGVALPLNALAYVIYTSGSTGHPKGVGIGHLALRCHVQAAIGFFGLTPADRMLQFSTLNFDGFVEQLFPPLAVGAAVVLRGPELWDSERLHREIVEREVSVADLTTAYWLLMAQDAARRPGRGWGALRQVHAGGEAMPPEGLKAWRDAGLAHVKLLNTYGPTEATVTATVLDCTAYVRGEEALPAQMPIGRALPGRVLRVLDAALNPVAPGVAGELCIGGALLARGYLGRAALTSERFVADPFDAQGGRLYRTGDLVRWRHDGQLEYLGRIDHQVKIRGFRVELGEIEAQLLAQPGVREAVVVAQEAPGGGVRLVGHAAGEALEAAALRGALAAALPDYMVPAVLLTLAALPLSANGKIDRKALPAPVAGAAEAGHEPPQGDTEEALAAIWCEVLGLPRVGRRDHFFELGGHSLSAMQMVARVQNLLQVALPVAEVFQAPVLAALAARLTERSRAAPAGQALSDIDSFIDSLETM
ncbi:amino acid adenylation domain-containing protein [Variovorax sp. WS11]|uniref:amino acid adenylation domain-containing protein n=1 Tax=Variovorax sp. WS11 TaxID=1105204 RepID=UPI001EF20BD0|nr:amino acid adenylation domain-containing protein [Variovorax sp. WS11]